MPAKSQAQFRFMQMLAHNPEKMKNKPKGLTPEKAKEYISENTGKMSYQKLPEHVEAKKKALKKIKGY